MTSFQPAFRQALRTFGRFPLVILAGLAGMAAALAANHLPHGREQAREAAGNLAMTGWMGVALLFSLALFAESRRLSRLPAWGLQALGLLLLAASYHYLGPDAFPVRMARFWLFLSALHLIAALAAALGRTGSVAAFWHFNQRLGARLAFSLAHTLVLFIGADAALLSVKNLFELAIPDAWFLDPGIAALGAFNTWYFLAGVPHPGAEQADRPYPRGLRILAQFILLPLVCVYMLILYAYTVKVLADWRWPMGWVSNLILGLSGAGMFSLLLVHPLLEKEDNPWIRFFSRHFYHALFPLLILLFVAIGKRIHDYGITENRYFVLGLAVWFAGIALYFTLDRMRDIRVIPASLGLICLLAAFGPWSAFEVSRKSQIQRLQGLLESHGMLVGGKLAKAAGRVPRRVNEEISAVAIYLEDRRRLADLRSWIPAMDGSGQTHTMAWDRALESKFAFMEALELPYLDPAWRRPGGSEIVSFFCRSCTGPIKKISGYDFLYANYQAAAGSLPQELPGQEGEALGLAFDSEAGVMRFVPKTEPELSIDLGEYFRALRGRYPDAYDLNLPEEEMVIEREDKTLKVLVRLRSLSGESGETSRLREFAGDLLIRFKNRRRPRD